MPYKTSFPGGFMVMGIVYWTLMIGFMTGAFAKFFLPHLKHAEVFTLMTIGLTGAVSFGFLGDVLGLYDLGELKGLIASFIGSTSLLFIYFSYIKTYGSKRPGHRRNF